MRASGEISRWIGGSVRRRLAGAALAVALGAGTAGCAMQPRGVVTPLTGPYKDLSIAFDQASALWSTDLRGARRPVAELLRPGTTVSWAFAVGECGAEKIGGFDPARVARANVAAFERAGIDYIVSTGGEAGVFTCASDAGMDAFVARYDSPRLKGIDFDIEGKQTPEMVEALVQRAVSLRQRRPDLRVSFTLATLAASDGSHQGLNALGRSVLASIGRSGLDGYTINLMVMDFGAPLAANCVVVAGACDMGRSAIQAAENLHLAHGVPYARIELTAMAGVNDVSLNDTSPNDLKVIARYAQERGMAGVHFWAMDRDQPCARPPAGASPLCSGLPDVPAGAFAEALGRPWR